MYLLTQLTLLIVHSVFVNYLLPYNICDIYSVTLCYCLSSCNEMCCVVSASPQY